MFSQYMSPAVRRALRDDEGLTLIEIIIAGFVLSIAVLGLASVASTSLISVRDSRERDRATAAASSALEAVRAMDYDDIAISSTATDWQSDALIIASGGNFLFDHDGDGTFTETIWASPTGEIDPYLCTSASTDCWFDVPEATRLEVRTFVTWYPNPVDQLGKRVTAVATWVEPSFSAPRIVRMSTLVSPATQGLPAPAFEVLPKQLSSAIDQIAIDDGHEECFQHTITNYGSIDTYDIELEPAEGWATWEAVPNGTWRNQHWVFRAYFVRSGETRGSATLMRADPAGVGYNVISPAPLDTGESANLYFCYAPRGLDGDDGTKPTPGTSPFGYEPKVRSMFDPDVDQDVSHRIDVVVEGLRLHLHYDHDAIFDAVYTRPVKAKATVGVDISLGGLDAGSEVFLFEQFDMNRTLPPPGSHPDYDVYIHYDGENIPLPGRANRPGLFLPRNPISFSLLDGLITQPAELFAVEWDWQFDTQTAPVTFASPPTVNLWAQQPDASDAPPPTARVCLQTQLLKLEMGADGILAETPVVIGGATRDFRATQQFRLLGSDTNDAPFTVTWNGGSQSFKPGDVLRMRIWNDGTLVGGVADNRTCVRTHLAFGVDTGSGTPREYVATLDLWP